MNLLLINCEQLNFFIIFGLVYFNLKSINFY